MAENTTLTFDRSEKGLKQLAIYLAQIVREGVTYDLDMDGELIHVKLTGGC